MVAFIRLPDAPPLCELTDGGAWERCEGMEWRETIGRDGEGKNGKVGGEREEDG